MTTPTSPVVPRWPHYLALFTVCATMPLLTVGAEVTTRGVGMVDPRGFRWPWEIISILGDAMSEGNLALAIELTHRMFGFLVGILAIALCVGFWRTMQGWKRWLGLLVLAAVVAQGLLGRYRVDLNALFGSTLALVHGGFAPLVFALLVATAVWSSRGWNAEMFAGQDNGRFRHWSLLTAGVIYLQLILGGIVRHKDVAFGARAHLLGAFLVVAVVAWLVKLAWEASPQERRGVGILVGLVTVQLGLGIESWLSRFAFRGNPWAQLEPLPLKFEWIRSAHYLVGTLTFATAVAVALYAHRQTAWATRPAPVLEGAA